MLLVWGPRKRLLVSGSTDRVVMLWDVGRGWFRLRWVQIPYCGVLRVVQQDVSPVVVSGFPSPWPGFRFSGGESWPFVSSPGLLSSERRTQQTRTAHEGPLLKSPSFPQ